jgi:hypothetical protein
MSRRVVPALVAVLAVLFWAAPAAGDPPARLTAAITDQAGVLGSGRGSAQAALDRLRARTGIELSVVFVPSFGDTTAQRWTDETARLSGMTGRQALLAVATADREYAFHPPADTRVTKGESAAVARNDVEPALTRGDWSGAVVAGADGLGAAATGSGSLTWVLILAIVVILVVGGWALLKRRRGPAVPAEDGRADALLIEVDNAFRARLAAGHRVPSFRAEVDAARAELTEAFRLRSALDAEPPIDAAARRAAVSAIIDRATTAARRLGAEVDLALGGPATADDTDQRRVGLEAAIPAAAKELQDLLSRYGESSATLIAANVDQARERLAFAANALIQARAAGGRTDELRVAELAVDQAEQLLGAMGRAGQVDVAGRVAAVDDFISTRRGVVGVEARVAISEARRHLTLAGSGPTRPAETRAAETASGETRLGETGPTETGLAEMLAELARRAALADVESWPAHSGADAARAGAMMGGILRDDG